MGIKAYTDGYSQSIGSVTMNGHWEDAEVAPTVNASFQWGYGTFGNNTSTVTSNEQAASYSRTPTVDKDRTIKFRAKCVDLGPGITSFGGTSGDFKTFANNPTADTPVVSSITHNSATVDCTFNPGNPLVESTFSVQLFYRKFGDVPWIAFGSPVTSGGSINRPLTGLLGNTIYQVKLVGARNTANVNDWESGIVSFTTLANAPTIATDAATVVTHSQATLNGTVDPNNIAGLSVRFGWGTADGGATLGNWQNATAPQSQTGDGDRGFQQLITGLAQTTQYFFRAFVEWP